MLDNTKYRQMAGRAGRAGIDTEGEAILVVSKDNYPVTQMMQLMKVRERGFRLWGEGDAWTVGETCWARCPGWSGVLMVDGAGAPAGQALTQRGRQP